MSNPALTQPHLRPSLAQRLIRGWHKHKWSYFFIFPSMLFFFIFTVYPVGKAVVLAFQKVDLRGSEWVGLKNFTDLLDSRLFIASMQHTFIYAFFVVAAWLVSSMLVAALIQPLPNRIQALFRGAFYLPNVISIVVISLVWIWIFEPQFGFFNYLLGLFGAEPVRWLQNPRIALWSIVLSTILIVPGSGVVIYSAAIGAIPRDYYEAAEVEGANALQKLLYITLPLLNPTTLYLMVIYTIAGFQIFERVYIMTRGGPINRTTTIVQLIYQTAFSDFNFGRASAQGLILFAIIAAFSFIQFKVLSQDVEY
jgi:multiple sugar transport system permease protein